MSDGPRRVLVVDDAPSIRAFLADALQGAGYEVMLAAGGFEALRSVAEGPADLVILNLHMPGLSGLDVCQRLRRDSSVPILMISAEGQHAVEPARALGANDFLAKPFTIEALLRSMGQLLTG